MSIARNINYLKSLPNMSRLMKGQGFAMFDGGKSRLTEVSNFGSNPGNLRMFTYVPANLPKRPALVVVLHGCTQSAAGYDLGSGWSHLADRYGFALLMPQQQRDNNPNLCFNWFIPDDVTRGNGEAASIRQMIQHVARERNVDPKRIFVTGLSAGGAMTSAMLATYPDVFSGGAIIAGIPYGVAANVQDALSAMYKAPRQQAHDLGMQVREASNHKGPWPKISVWHGSADTTVIPANADHVVSQWLDVHGLPVHPMFEDVVDGHPRQGWWDADGNTVVESYLISDMAHGTPLNSIGDDQLGQAGPFMLEAGISSSYHIATFWGLTGATHRVSAPEASVAVVPAKTSGRASAARPTRMPKTPPPYGGSVNGVITRALTAAGLMKPE